jgi:hypothetical protein
MEQIGLTSIVPEHVTTFLAGAASMDWHITVTVFVPGETSKKVSIGTEASPTRGAGV